MAAGIIPATVATVLLLLLASRACLGITQSEQIALNDMLETIANLDQLSPPWIRNVDPCGGGASFHGLSCKGTSVGKISLRRRNLQGSIPSSIGNLIELDELDLSFNFLNGNLTEAIGNLVNLTFIDLSFTSMTGTLSERMTALPKLNYLNVASNELSGPLPSNWSSSLLTVDVGFNLFSGQLPTQLLQLPALTTLKLDIFNGEGIVLSDIMQTVNLPNLTTFSLVGSNVTGAIPSLCGRMNRLQKLSLDENPITGPVGPGLECLTELAEISLDSTNVEFLGSELSQLVNLTTIYLRRTNMTNATIPDFLGSLPRLQILQIDRAKLRATIPPSLFQSRSLKTLSLQNNFLFGALPPISMPELSELYLNGNSDLNGTLPQGIASTNLTILSLSYTSISGVFPPDISRLNQTLQKLYVGNSRITGPLPDSLWSLTGLTELSLASLTGLTTDNLLPQQLERLSSLIVLDVDGCGFIGPIPQVIYRMTNLSRLSMRSNGFSGSIDTAIANLRSLTHLRLYGNNLDGELPSALSYGLPNLGDLDLSMNSNLGGCIEFRAPAGCFAAGSKICGCSKDQCGVTACTNVTCPGTRPEGAICSLGRWVIPGSVIVDRPTTFTRVTISGSLVISSNSSVTTTIVVQDRNATLSVDGCVSFAGALNVSLTTLPSNSDQYQLATFGGYCGNVQTRFSNVDVYSSCGRVSGASLRYEERSLTLAFGSDFSDGCTNGPSAATGFSSATVGIIVGCVVGGVFLLAIIGAVVLVKVPRVRQRLFPFRDRLAQKTTDDDL